MDECAMKSMVCYGDSSFWTVLDDAVYWNGAFSINVFNAFTRLMWVSILWNGLNYFTVGKFFKRGTIWVRSTKWPDFDCGQFMTGALVAWCGKPACLKFMSKFNRSEAKKYRIERCGATSKRIFRSHEAAMEFIVSLGETDLKRAYRCQYCGLWHCTSQN